MENIIALPGAGEGSPPVQEVIDRLEAALVRARAGSLRSFALVSVETRCVVATEWCATDGFFHEISSGLALIQYRFQRDNGSPT